MAAGVKCTCPYCEQEFIAATGRFSRAQQIGAPLYCSRECAGLVRRSYKAEEDRKAEKAAYDRKRREENAEKIKQQKAEYFKRTYDPIKAAVERKARIQRHIEYCRRPEYKEWKREYDREYRAKRLYGEFAEAFLTLQNVEQEILSRATRYEIDIANEKLCKAQKRRRSS